MVDITYLLTNNCKDILLMTLSKEICQHYYLFI